MEVTQEEIEKIYKLKLKKLSPDEISKISGVPPDRVKYISTRYLSFLRDLDVYEEHKTDILMGLQKNIIGLMIQKADKATFRDLSTAFGILEDKINLRQGNSTANIAVGMSIRLEDLVGRKERMERQLLSQGIRHSQLSTAIASQLLEDKKTITLPIDPDPVRQVVSDEQGIVQTPIL